MDKLSLKYFLGSKFLYRGKEVEVVSIDVDDEDGNYYQVTDLGWVSDDILDDLEPVVLT